MKAYFVIIGVLVVIIASLIGLSVSFERTLQMETAEQFNKQQQLLSNAEASSIQAYIDSLKNEMLNIAYFASMFQIRKEKDFSLLTNVLFEEMDNEHRRVELLDRQGKVSSAEVPWPEMEVRERGSSKKRKASVPAAH